MHHRHPARPHVICGSPGSKHSKHRRYAEGHPAQFTPEWCRQYANDRTIPKIKAEQLREVLKAKVRRIRTPHLASVQLGNAPKHSRVGNAGASQSAPVSPLLGWRSPAFMSVRPGFLLRRTTDALNRQTLVWNHFWPGCGNSIAWQRSFVPPTGLTSVAISFGD